LSVISLFDGAAITLFDGSGSRSGAHPRESGSGKRESARDLVAAGRVRKDTTGYAIPNR
jgi:hypothetical protein